MGDAARSIRLRAGVCNGRTKLPGRGVLGDNVRDAGRERVREKFVVTVNSL